MAVRSNALIALGRFPASPLAWSSFQVVVGSEVVWIPHRIYHDPTLIETNQLTPEQIELVDCLLTRHHSGIVRQARLERIILSRSIWVPAFVIQLMGEYVIEILQVIHSNCQHLDRGLYRAFLQENPQFFAKTQQRIFSYWDRYYREQAWQEYAGSELLAFFAPLADRPAVGS